MEKFIANLQTSLPDGWALDFPDWIAAREFEMSDFRNAIDYVLTDGSGAELAEVLFSRGLASRFLFVSGFGSAAEYNEDYGPLLAKPFSSESLLHAVSRLLI